MVTDIAYRKIQQAIETQKVLTFTTYSYRADERDYIDAILDEYLIEAGREDLQNQLSYCIHELAGNAKKANTKRVYFFERGLNIENETEYCIGMNNFKNETIVNIDHYILKLREYGFYVKFQFKICNEWIKIAVRNNARLLTVEEARIKKKLSAARKYQDMTEAYADIEDTSEGAGLGLVMMLLMLRNIGLEKNLLSIFPKRDETVSLLTIPRTVPK
jgi:hypothetical protein